MGKKIFISTIFFFFLSFGYAQFAYRLKADILTKTRLPDSTFQISKGQIHYDQNIKKIVFDFTFPEKEKVVIFDTLMYSFRNDAFFQKSKSMLVPEQSFFQFILSGNMTNYGFDKSNFKIQGTEKTKDMIVTTWVPPDGLKKYISKVLVATKNKQLYSVTLLDAKDKVINRQILKNYKMINGMDIPHEVLVATYLESGSMYQIISLNNVVINEQGNNKNYDHDL
jgi:hypothetical protein